MGEHDARFSQVEYVWKRNVQDLRADANGHSRTGLCRWEGSHYHNSSVTKKFLSAFEDIGRTEIPTVWWVD